MKKKYYIFILVNLLIGTNNLFAEENDAIDYLYENRLYIATLLKPITFKAGPKNIEMMTFPKKILIKYIEEDKTNWEKNREDILDAFSNLCIGTSLKDTSVSFSHDTVLIHGMVKVLDCGEQKFERRALRALTRYSPYKYLKLYSKEIIKRVRASSNTSKDKKELIILSDPPENIRMEMIKDSTINLPFKARLGDNMAEDSLIQILKEAKNFLDASKAINNLFICGTKKSLSSIFNEFNSPIYSKNRMGCINNSLRKVIIEGLQRYYPDEKLLNDRYNSLYRETSVVKICEQYYCFDKEIKKYLEGVVIWGKKEFGTTPRGEIGEPILFKGPCDSVKVSK